MGQSETKVSCLEIEQLKGFEFLGKIEDKRYGPIGVYRDINSLHKVALVDQVFNDLNQIEIKGTRGEGQQILQLDHESVVKLHKFFEHKIEAFCSNYTKVFRLYEYIDYDFEQDLFIRSQSKTPYTESEIWHILLSIIAAIAYINSRIDLHYSDIRPKSVLIDSDGKVKILAKTINKHQGETNYQEITMQQNLSGSYLSPQLFAQAGHGELKPLHDPQKSDIFALAIFVMECCLLRSVQNCYNFSNYTISYQHIEGYLQVIGQTYSQSLVQFLAVMLEKDQSKRPEASALYCFIEVLIQKELEITDHLYSLNNPSQPEPEISQPSNRETDFRTRNFSKQYSPQKFEQLVPECNQLISITNYTSINRKEKVKRSEWVLKQVYEQNKKPIPPKHTLKEGIECLTQQTQQNQQTQHNILGDHCQNQRGIVQKSKIQVQEIDYSTKTANQVREEPKKYPKDQIDENQQTIRKQNSSKFRQFYRQQVYEKQDNQRPGCGSFLRYQKVRN